MTSRIWPPPTAEESAAIADEDNPLDPACEECECDPCQCDWCGDCGCEDCECETCDVCGMSECECPGVHVVYTTTVTVCVDGEGDITGVTIDTNLGDPDLVLNWDGRTTPRGPLRDRALAACAERDWPSWDFS